MNPKHLPPDSVLPDEPEDISEDLAETIRMVAARECPVGFPVPMAAGLVIRVLLSEEIQEKIRESNAENLLSTHEQETIRKLVSEFIDADNPRLRAQCYDLAFRLGLQMGITQDSVAAQHGVGRAAVSKECRRIVREYHLPPARGMKSTQAVEVYRERQKRKHQERRENHKPWEFAIEFAQAMAQPDRNTAAFN